MSPGNGCCTSASQHSCCFGRFDLSVDLRLPRLCGHKDVEGKSIIDTIFWSSAVDRAVPTKERWVHACSLQRLISEVVTGFHDARQVLR